ncbi:MAG: hypothetical protein CSA58_09790 [Micrococcales bacterium]|nr:MAG: hypothetical protein CSB46_07355 [Micrococcales bacterium]PIE26388.1 MAG: hypothetical protein CSA58_09790 [Micrococcales bacterium]
MAQKVQLLLVDDVDGGEAVETVAFALDGVSYEIDLNEDNAAELREGLSPWVGHARRVGGRVRRGRARTNRGAVDQVHDTGAIRAWARDAGYEVSDRGRIASTIISAYNEAHGLA